MFYRITALKDFPKFTRKHLPWSPIGKFEGWWIAIFVKKNTLSHGFPCEFSEIFHSSLFTENLLATASRVENKTLNFCQLKNNWYHKSLMHLTKYIAVRFKIQPSHHHLVDKVKNINTRTMYEIFSKLNIKTPERRKWSCPSVFIVHFELISLISLWCLHSWLWILKGRLGQNYLKNMLKNKLHKKYPKYRSRFTCSFFD